MISFNNLLRLSLLLCIFFFWTLATKVSQDGRSLTIDGEKKIIISGSIHYPRSTPEMWSSLIEKARDGGLNAIETYVFWNAHEPIQRQYDFSGNLDLVRFIKTIQSKGLHVILRIGPYVCAEWNYGGFPVWLHNIPGMKFRTNNQAFMDEMQTFTTFIVDMMKGESLFTSQGGPIILAQIENEYGNVMGSYGEAGKSYINWCAQLAESFNIDVPWIMCQQGDAPQPMINTCNGYYCDQFQPNNENSPKMWTENWTGWYKDWGMQDPHRTAEDLAFAVGRFFQYGGTLQNYYMYHGGTNFGRTAGGPYISTSYDYDAPLDEYGNLNQPKWGHLKRLHELIISMEQVLTYGSVNNTEYGNQTTATIYSYEGKSSCFFGNADWHNDMAINFENNTYTVPAWSVTILPDCRTEVYNTAKVNSQTTIMTKKSMETEDNEELYGLRWQWRKEHPIHATRHGVRGGILTTDELLDQKVVTNDTSDYLWYLTSVKIDNDHPIYHKEITLRVHTKGHILHAYVNNKLIGTQSAKNGQFEFTFEGGVERLRHGRNHISLLSATVGLANYGAHFEDVEVGVHGPVELIGDKNGDSVTIDLSYSKWTYKVGLRGEEEELYKPSGYLWFHHNIPTYSELVWYKTTFKAPPGDDPIVVDLLGLGKGHAWVNGNSIGRYWAGYRADDHGCGSCDFHGAYNAQKCLTNCGKPTQRWYHVPRSYTKDGLNTLVLFEELGGNPWNVNFQTVSAGTVCADAHEGNTLELSCHRSGQVMSELKFVSFGEPSGLCGSFKKGKCESPIALSAIKKECLGKESCSIDVSEMTLGPTGCNAINRLAVELDC